MDAVRVECEGFPEDVLVPIPSLSISLGALRAHVVQHTPGLDAGKTWLLDVCTAEGGVMAAEGAEDVPLEDLVGGGGEVRVTLKLHPKHIAETRIHRHNAAHGITELTPQLLVERLVDGSVDTAYLHTLVESELVAPQVLSLMLGYLCSYQDNRHMTVAREVLKAGVLDVNQHATPNGVTPLMMVCRSGATENARRLIAAGADIDAMTTAGEGVLDFAVMSSKADVVECILAETTGRAARVNRGVVGNGRTPLIHAAAARLEHIALRLLECGAAHNAVDNTRTSALLYACANGQKRLCHALLAMRDIEVNVPNRVGSTPLLLASARDDMTDVCLELMRAGARVRVIVQTPAARAKGARADGAVYGMSPLAQAAAAGLQEVCLAMLAQLRATPTDPVGLRQYVNTRTENGDTALTFAAHTKMTDVCRELIQLGADKNARTSKGYTPLTLAVAAKDVATAMLLLDVGAGVAYATQGGDTALTFAVHGGLAEVADRILDVVLAGGAPGGRAAIPFTSTDDDGEGSGEDADAPPLLLSAASNGNTPLALAAAAGLWGACARMVPHMDLDSVNAVGSTGETALSVATSKGTAGEPLAQSLVERFAGSGLHIDGPYGRRGLAIAIHNFQDELLCTRLVALAKHETLDGFIEGGADTLLTIAAAYRREAVCEALLARGVDATVVTARGATTLSLAAPACSPRVCLAILDRMRAQCGEGAVGAAALAAHVNTATHDNQNTALILLAARATPGGTGDDSTVEDVALAVLDAGADAGCANTKCETPLLFAACHGCTRLVEALLAAGAPPDVPESTHGNTALGLAVSRGYEAVVWALTAAGADVNRRNKKGDWSLTLAVAGRQHTVAAWLLEYTVVDVGAEAVRRLGAGALKHPRWLHAVRQAQPGAPQAQELD